MWKGFECGSGDGFSHCCLSGLKWAVSECVRELPPVGWFLGCRWISVAPLEPSLPWILCGLVLEFVFTYFSSSRRAHRETELLRDELERVRLLGVTQVGGKVEALSRLYALEESSHAAKERNEAHSDELSRELGFCSASLQQSQARVLVLEQHPCTENDWLDMRVR